MKTFDQVWDETEGKTRIQNEIVCKAIILELEKECNIHFPIEEVNSTYSGFLPVFLFDSHYIEYREKLLEIMEKYPIDWSNIMFRFVGMVHQNGIPPLFERMVENAFKTLPYCKIFEKIENGYVIETLDGILEFCKLSETVYYPSLYGLLCNNVLKGRCHEAVYECKDYFPQTEIVTSELQAMTSGIFYHSYLKDENTNEVIDFSLNTVYKNNTFDTFYKPNEIQVIPNMMLDEYLKQLPKETTREHCKVLELALQNKMKFDRES